LNPSDRVFGLTRMNEYEVRDEENNSLGTTSQLLNPWGESHTLSARFDYVRQQGSDRVSVFAEVGGALRPFDSDFAGTLGPTGSGLAPHQPAGNNLDQASRIGLSAQKTTRLGALTGIANLQVGLGAEGLLPHKRFVLGGRSLEAQWQNDTYRQARAGFERPAADAHLVGFGTAGPVAYLRADRPFAPGRTGRNILAGRLSLGGTPFPNVNPLSPLGLSVFSGLGTTWTNGDYFAGFATDDLVGDAGFGARYAISEIPHLDRWTAQSDFLQGLDVVAKFPIWASDPALIESDQDELAFRWLIGVEL
ncbi:MAG TPA: hypothetical protein VJ884_03235, partial [Salinibacter sp.]|nr:hypothetical protein [Salinibacter sp.]